MKNPIDEVRPRTSSMTQRVRQLHSTRRQVWCPFARYPASRSARRSPVIITLSFSDLRLFVMLDPLYWNSTAEIRQHRMVVISSLFSRSSAAAGPHGRGAVRSVVAARSPVRIARTRDAGERVTILTHRSRRADLSRAGVAERKQSAMIPRPMRMRCASRLASCKAAPLGPLRSILRRVCF